jgi:hypothetical protein
MVAMLGSASPVSAQETVTILAADCTTPQTIFHLGDTVCAKVDNVAGGDLNNIYLEWVTPSGAVLFGSAATTLVTTTPQTFTQLLPTSGANVEFGRWRARTANTSDTSPRVTANFDVARLSVIGIRRGSTFYFRSANTVGPGDVVFPFGDAGDVGLIGDWNGDGSHTPGLYRPSTQTFFLASTLPFAGIPDLVIPYGAAGDIPLVGDWDGNGTWTIGVYRPSDNTFYLRNSNTAGPADLVIPYGDPGDLPVVGDWDGDGTWTIGVYRPSNNTFYLRNSNTVGIQDILIPYGAPGDKPVVGDWNADDLKSTIGIYRPAEATFYLRNSNTIGFADLVIPFGDLGDTPVIARVNVNKAPMVDPATFSLPENSPNGTVVGTATYVDLDFGQSHTFGITAGNTGTAFAINTGTGQITVANSAALDFETTPQFLLTVQVTDNGTPPRSGSNTITVNLTNVNEAPSITAGGTLNYTEDQAATAIDTTVNVTDDGNLAGATIQITTNCTAAQDVLSFVNTVNIAGTPGSCSMTLAGSDTVANYITALRSVKYANTSQSPSTAARTVSWQVTDGTFSSNTATSTINVTSVNDAPQLTAGGTLNYTENQAATAIDTTITITDADSANLTGATVQITGNCSSAQDVLSFANTVNIIGTPGSCSMSLAGTDTVANYITALKSVKYSNNSEDPSGLTRTVTWQVNDGAVANNLSNTATSTINVTPVNDAPVGVIDRAHAVTGNVRIQVPVGANSLLNGVTDPEGNALTAQVDGSSTHVGNITINADGSYIYNPKAGHTAADVVKYKVCDNGAPSACSAIKNLTFNVSDMLWFIDNNLGAAGDGRLTSPFNSIAGFTGINDGGVDHPATGQTIFIDRNVATDYTGPLTLLNNQKVLGKGGTVGLAAFAVITLAPDSDPLPSTSGTAPNITTSAAATNAVNVASGNTLRGFNGGNTTGSKISGTGFGTLTTSEITLSGSGQALNLTTGTLSGSLAGTTSSSGTNNVLLSGVATSGTYNLGSGALSGATSEALFITGQNGSFTYGGTITNVGGTQAVRIESKTGGTVTLSGNINPSVVGAAKGILVQNNNTGTNTIDFTGSGKTINTGAGTGVNLATNTGATISFTNGGLDIDTTSGTGFNATGGGTVNVSGATNTITTTTGTALNLNGTGGTIGLDSVTTAGGGAGAAHIALSSVTGPVTITGGSLAGAAAGIRAIDISAGSANFTYGGTINSGGVRAINRTGTSTVLISGTSKVLNTGTTNAVDFTGNSATSTLTFSGGGLDIDTTTGFGFNATSGIVNVTGANNTINSGSGTALNVANSTIGASNLNFQSISSSGGSATGIILDTTGASGGLIVNGDGSNTTKGGNSTGGTITGKSGADGSTTTGIGIYLNNTSNVVLRRMTINGTNQNYGIRGLTVNNFTLEYSTVGGTNGTSATLDEGTVSFGSRTGANGMTGTGTITKSVFSGGFEDNFSIFNSSGTLSITMDDISSSGAGNDGVVIQARTSATVTADIKNSEFSANFGDHFNGTGDDSANVTFNFGNNGANTLTGGGAGSLGQSITIQTGVAWAGTGSANVANNSINGAIDTPININIGGTGTFNAKVDGNTIGTSGVANSGTTGNKDAIRIVANGDASVDATPNGGTLTAAVRNNTIQQVSGNGIFVIARDGGTVADPILLNITITGNTLKEPNPGNNAIRLESGATSTDHATLNADIGGAGAAENDVQGDWGVPVGADEIRLRHQFSALCRFILRDLGANQSTGGPVATYLAGRNTTFPPATASATIAGGGVYETGGAPPLPP